MKQLLSERLLVSTALAGALSLTGTPPAYANPIGGQVVGGQANISSSGNTLTVQQTTSRAIINWQSFDIGAGETTQFVQPSSSSIALNRVGGGNPSQILGNLDANGQVWIINPNGVMFGGNASVNVAGLVATSANIKDSDFMAGNYNFSQSGNPNAAISNAGTITAADAGLVAFVAPTVTNSGMISAKLGKVQLGSGDTFTLDLYGDGLINLQASPAVTQQLVANSGMIQANGGTVTLTAAAAQNTVNSLINMSGIVQAQSIANQNGTIVLYAEGSNAVQNNVAANKGQESGDSTVLVSGTLDASGLSSGQTGGSISVLGDHVGILTDATLTASGDAGGGYIKIGGDFHGAGTTPTAIATVVQGGANIDADALTSGNGGNVAVWSDDYTNFAGNISARGGALSGNGGFVETSGKQTLDMNGLVDASAPNGTAGTWLMDPNNLVVNGSTTSNAGSSPDWTAGSGGGNVLNTDIDAALNAGTSVDLTASGSIEVSANISKSSGGDANLTLAAGTDITVDSSVSIASTSGKLNTIVDADTALGGGAIVLNSGSSITSNGGSITLGGGANPATTAAVGDVTSSGIGINVNGASLNAGSGNISLLGTGQTSGTNTSNAYGIYVQNGGIVQTSGTLTATGTGGGSGTGSTNSGIYIIGTNSTIKSTGSGTLSLTGNGGVGGSAGTDGLDIEAIDAVQATGSGGITINGTGGSGTADNRGVEIYSPAGGSVAANGGNISIMGTGYSYGAVLSTGSVVSNTGAGTIAITGSGTSANGIQLYKGSSITSTGSGAITLSGTSTGTSGIKMWSTTNTIGGPSYSGNITLDADTLTLTSFTAQTTGNVTFAPYTASTPVGFSGGAGTLQITQAIMDDVNSPTVTIGSTSDTGLLTTGAFSWEHTLTNLNLYAGGSGGAVTIGGNITKGVDDGSVANSSNGTLTVLSGSDIVQNSSVAISSSSTYGELNTVFDADYAGSGGAIVMNSGSSITSNGGSITMGGQGSPATMAAVGDATNLIGINLNGATLNATGGNIILNGTGNAASSSNTAGIYAQNAAIVETSGTGTINLIGNGGANGGSESPGVYVVGGSIISAVNGDVTVTGYGGGANACCDGGFYVTGTGSTVETTGTGSVSVTGTANGGIVSRAVVVNTANGIQATGSGNISVTGYDQAGGGVGYNIGVFVEPGSSITANGGNISVVGTAAPNDNNDWGVTVQGGISTTGHGTIKINGTGGSGSTSNNYGVIVSGTVSAVDGDVIVQGTGGGAGAGIDNYGVYVTGAGNTIQTTGSGNVEVTGIRGGGNTSNNYGVTLDSANGIQTSGTGAIAIASDSLNLGAANAINSASTASITPYTTSATVGVAGAGGTVQYTSTILADVSATSLTIGSSSDTGGMAVNAYTWGETATLLTGSGNIVVNGVQTMGSNRFLADTTSGNLTFGASGGVSSSATGNAITLAASHGGFINDAGASALSASNGRWLIYSTSPTSNTLGGLVGAFSRYGCVFGGDCSSFPATGNGLLYTFNPTGTIVSQMSAAAPSPTAQTASAQADATSGPSIDVDSELLTPPELSLKSNNPKRWWKRITVQWDTESNADLPVPGLRRSSASAPVFPGEPGTVTSANSQAAGYTLNETTAINPGIFGTALSITGNPLSYNYANTLGTLTYPEYALSSADALIGSQGRSQANVALR